MGQIPVVPTVLANEVIPVSDELSAPQLPNIVSDDETGLTGERPQPMRNSDSVDSASTPLQAPAQWQRATTTRAAEPASIVAQWPGRSSVASSPSSQQMASRGEERSFVDEAVTSPTVVTSVTPPAVQLAQEPISGTPSMAGEAGNHPQEPTPTEQAEDDRIWSRLKVIQQAHAHKQMADDPSVQRTALAQNDAATFGTTRGREQSAPRPIAIQRSKDALNRNRGEAVPQEVAPTTSVGREDAPVEVVQDEQGMSNRLASATVGSNPHQPTAVSTGPSKSPVARVTGQRPRSEQSSVLPAAATDTTSLNLPEVAEANLLNKSGHATAGVEPDRLSLDQVWPVQHATESAERSPADESGPGTTDAAGESKEHRAAIPFPGATTEQDRQTNDTVQAALQNVPPARSTESAVHIMAPRRPRPVRQRREQRQDSPPDLAPQPASDSLGMEQQELSTLQAKADEQQANSVVTEIGELPSDLWALIDEPIPTHYEHKSSNDREAGTRSGETAAAPQVKPQDIVTPTTTGISPLGEQAVPQIAGDTQHAASADAMATSAANAVQRTPRDETAKLSSGDSVTGAQPVSDADTATRLMVDSPVAEHVSTASEENLAISSGMPFLQNGSQHNHANDAVGPIAGDQGAVHRVDKRNVIHPIQRHASATTAPIIMKATLPDEDESASSIGGSLEGNDTDLALLMDELDANEGTDAGTGNPDETESSDIKEDGDHDEDISELARQVYAYLQRRLVVERERMG